MKLLDVLQNEKFYVQGASGVPIFGSSTGDSAFLMKQYLGYGFEYLPQDYRQGYLEIYYPRKDLDAIWNRVDEGLKGDPLYLEGIKRIYDQNIRLGLDLYAEMDGTDVRNLSDQDLLGLFKRCLEAQVQTVGVGHILEPVGLGLEDKFKAHLQELVPDRQTFNQAYAVLTEPSKPSFIHEEQKDLASLLSLKGQELDRALDKHIAKYFYIQNGYSGPRPLTKEQCLERLEGLKQEAAPKATGKLPSLTLDQELKSMIKLIDYMTAWQDERKRNILVGISYLGRITEEVARRTGMDHQELIYLTNREVIGFDSLQDIQKVEPELSQRRAGFFFAPSQEDVLMMVGEEYIRCHEMGRAHKGDGAQNGLDAIYGTVANTGTAVGRVAICRDLDSINKVQSGDILVTSMTRPEYMATIKKAAAIVTDEGGITCHAAIVARELGIPCIIGTKIATQVLKDGMQVAVRANHGTVIKL